MRRTKREGTTPAARSRRVVALPFDPEHGRNPYESPFGAAVGRGPGLVDVRGDNRKEKDE